MISTLKTHLTKGRIITGCFVILAIGGVGYFALPKSVAATRYMTAPAQKGLFIATITASGQVSDENQVDVKPTVSAKITTIPVTDGQQVKKGDVLATLDPTDGLQAERDASQAVRNAQLSLESAKLSLAKLKQPPTASDLLLANDALNSAERDLAKLQDPPNAHDLAQAQAQVDSAQQNTKLAADGVTPQVVRNAYDTLDITLKTTQQSLDSALADSDSILAVDNTTANANFSNLLSVLDTSQKQQAIADYSVAKQAITTSKTMIDALASQNEDTANIDLALTAAQDSLKKTQTLLTSVSRALQATVTSATFSSSSLDSLKSSIDGDRSDINSRLSSLLTQTQAITNAKTTYTNAGISLQQAQISLAKLQEPADPKDIAAAQEKIKEKQQAIADLNTGANAVDIQISQNNVNQRIADLNAAGSKYADTAKTLEDYTLRAPFDGIVAKVLVHVGDEGGSGTAIVTMIAKQQLADVTLNEVDAAKVKVGEKATLTFDALDGVSITGEVQEISTLGTVTQGVVNYDVKVGFDTQDDRVKPGMSVSAAIITQMDQDVILVPNAAVKTAGTQSYVQLLGGTASSTAADGSITGTPRQQAVQVGSANDSMTEITQGLSEGDSVVIQTIAPSTGKTTAATTQRPGTSGSLIPGLGGGGAGGGGNFRGGGATFTRGG